MKIRIYDKEELSFFPLYAFTANYDSFQPKTVRPTGYEMPQIFLVNSGNGILNIGNESFILTENDFFYIDADIPHEYSGTDALFHTSYLSFFGSGFDGIKSYYNLGDYGVYKNKNRGSFALSVKKLVDVFDNTDELSSLCALTFGTVTEFFDEACKKEYDDIERVLKFIEENYSKPLTLGDILSCYPYSKAKLCRDFKEKYSESIFDVLTKIRLSHARHLITNFPHIGLKSIAASCGFSDVSYFCKMYKRKYGHTPKGEESRRL